MIYLKMFTGPVGPVEVCFYWPEAGVGDFFTGLWTQRFTLSSPVKGLKQEFMVTRDWAASLWCSFRSYHLLRDLVAMTCQINMMYLWVNNIILSGPGGARVATGRGHSRTFSQLARNAKAPGGRRKYPHLTKSP